MTELTYVERAARVQLMIFDVDGVLTDGSLHYGADGEALKTFNVYDGLGISYLHQGGHDKLTPFKALLEKTGLTAEQVGFIGDDVVDLPIIARVGFAVAVPNGRPEVLARVHHVTTAQGGRGAVREVCELLLQAQGTHAAVMAQFMV